MIEKPFLDEFGMVTSQPSQSPTENGPLYTAQAALLGLFSTTEAIRLVNQCFDADGLFRRYPNSTWQDRGPDNTIGVCALSVYLASRIHDYGNRTFPKWIYNQERPKKISFFAWQGRQPGLIGLMKFCKHPEEWVPVRRFIWNVGVIITGMSRKKDQHGRLHTTDRLLVETSFLGDYSHGFTYEWVKKWWRKKIDRDFGFPGIRQSGLNSMVKIYFPDGHPFRAVWGRSDE